MERVPNVATSNFMLGKGVVLRRNVNEFEKLQLRYFADITDFCDACSIYDTLAKSNGQFVLKHVVATEPFEILVKLGGEQWKFVLTIMDVFSRYAF